MRHVLRSPLSHLELKAVAGVRLSLAAMPVLPQTPLCTLGLRISVPAQCRAARWLSPVLRTRVTCLPRVCPSG